MSIETIVTCDKCNSNDIEINKEYKNKQHTMVHSWNGLGGSMSSEYRCVAADIELNCKCKSCGHTFTEDGGSYNNPISRGEWT